MLSNMGFSSTVLSFGGGGGLGIQVGKWVRASLHVD